MRDLFLDVLLVGADESRNRHVAIVDGQLEPFAEQRFSENLAFVEEALGRDIRAYFVRDFYADHLKRYQKRPIYWLFSSPNGSFNALIYMHRYRADTVSVVLNAYLRELRAKLTAHHAHLDAVSISQAVSAR